MALKISNGGQWQYQRRKLEISSQQSYGAKISAISRKSMANVMKWRKQRRHQRLSAAALMAARKMK